MSKENKVKNLIKKLVGEIVTEAKRMNYKERDWKKINKIAKKKDVFIQTSYGDQFKWEEGSRYGVFATEDDGREIELDHDDIDVIMVEGKLDEKAKRDYKAEYKKYGSSKKAKKYRAELNKYNRQKGTYGNGDKKDASHKGGKIVGFEEQSKNRGRAEKSRLKKEGKLNEFNKAHFLNLIKQEVDSLKGQVAYAKDKVNYKGTPDWEKKEFKGVLKDLLKKLKDTEKHYKKVQKLKEGNLNEEKYVVASIYGDLYTPKAVSEKKALKLMMKIADQYAGDNVFMLGVKAWNKPHKYNKKKIKVKEAMSRRIAGKTLKIPQPGDFGNNMDKYFTALNKHMKEVEKLAKLQKKKGVKESVWALPKGATTTSVDELDAELSRAGIKSNPDFTRLLVKVDGNKGKINKIMKTHKATKVFEGKLRKEIREIVKEACQKGYMTHPTRKTKEMFGKRYRNCVKKENAAKNHDGKAAPYGSGYKKAKKKIKESQVAKTILQQLGGNKFIAMTGAKNLGASGKSLSMKIGRNSKSINYVVITLKSSDLYDVEFIRMRGAKRTVVKKVKGVYADMLQKIFTKYTGMRTSL